MSRKEITAAIEEYLRRMWREYDWGMFSNEDMFRIVFRAARDLEDAHAVSDGLFVWEEPFIPGHSGLFCAVKPE